MKRRNKAKAAKAAIPFDASDVMNVAKSNPYVRRVVEDKKLRENFSTAVSSSKSAYGRLSSGKTTPEKLMKDKKLQGEVREALEAVRDVSIALTDAPRRRARKGLRAGRVLVLGTVAGTVVVIGNEKLRSKVLDTLFGAEEEFQYTPPSGGSSSQEATPVSAA
ncbi:MAG: hypothetical protein JOZ73_06935 [Solirubrobacterales bacterium]|nr:hypothetical protein [Solirubrobacterales bacterium]